MDTLSFLKKVMLVTAAILCFIGSPLIVSQDQNAKSTLSYWQLAKKKLSESSQSVYQGVLNIFDESPEAAVVKRDIKPRTSPQPSEWTNYFNNMLGQEKERVRMIGQEGSYYEDLPTGPPVVRPVKSVAIPADVRPVQGAIIPGDQRGAVVPPQQLLAKGVATKDCNMIKKAIKDGASLERYYAGTTILNGIASLGCLDLVKGLIETGQVDVNRTDTNGSTALMNVLKSATLDDADNATSIATYLIEQGADVDLQDGGGETAGKTVLDIAGNKGFLVDVVKLLEKKGAKTGAAVTEYYKELQENRREFSKKVAEKDQKFQEQEPRKYADDAPQEQEYVAQEVPEEHAVAIPEQGQLEKAIKANDCAAIETIIQQPGFDVNQIVDAKRGFTILHKVILMGCFPAAIELVKKGANVKAVSKEGRTALHMASVLSGSSPLVEELVKKGADVNAKDNSGNTPLNFVFAGNETVEKTLKEHGAKFGADLRAPVKNGASQPPM